MKNIFIAFIALLMCAGISAQEKNADKEAIKKVITDATDAFRTRNFNKIAATYVQDETLVKTGVAKSGFNVNDGWKNVSENYKTAFKNNPETVPGKFEKVNFRIKVYAESAWAVHDEIVHGDDGSNYKSVITHFLEKHDGQWKVVYMANIRASSWDETAR